MEQPVNLKAALATFEQVYSPRIVARVNDYDVRIAHTRGEHLWHVHDDTDDHRPRADLTSAHPGRSALR